jgi:hypothetical protein
VEVDEGVEWAEGDETLFDDEDMQTLGFMGDDIEDHVITLSKEDISRVGDGRGTHFPSDNFLASLKSCPITVILEQTFGFNLFCTIPLYLAAKYSFRLNQLISWNECCEL